MSERELLQKWRDLKKIIEESQPSIEKKDNVIEDSSQGKGGPKHGKVKTIGAHPDAKHFLAESEEHENSNGFASALLLGFLTLIFQLLFIAITYIIIK